MLCKLVVEFSNYSMEITECYNKVIEYGKCYCNKVEVKKVTIFNLSNQDIIAIGGQGILRNTLTNEIL